MKNRKVRYGIIIGGVISLAMFLSHLFAGDPPDFAMMEVVGYTSMILALLGIIFGIRARRDEQGGRITFGEATKVGMAIAGVAALVVGLYTAIHIIWIDPDYGAKYIAYEEQNMIEAGASQTEIDETMAEYESMSAFFENPILQGLVMAATIFGFGAIITLISALILKRREPESGELRTA